MCAVLACAQDVGMGRRKGSGAHLEAPYTLEIETPHTKWAKPLKGDPIRLLAVPTVSEVWTLVELAQRSFARPDHRKHRSELGREQVDHALWP